MIRALPAVWVSRLFVLASASAGLYLAGCKAPRHTISVLAAASLGRALADFETQFEQEHPTLDVQLEFGGSKALCRKITELRGGADVLLSADYRLIDELLHPEHAAFTVQLATNALVLAYGPHSPRTDDVNADNWPQVLADSKVKLGLADPDRAPLGYHTQLLWQLAEDAKTGPHLATRMRARCRPEHIVADEAQLLELLQTRAIDYAFVYRSTAEAYNLKHLTLPSRYDLGDITLRSTYARVRVTHALGRLKHLPGDAVVYGLTILTRAQNRAGALRFVEALLGAQGRGALTRAGLTPLQPARCTACPPPLARLVTR